VSLLLSTDADVIIIDPEREYKPLVEAMDGQVIQLSATSKNHINCLDINKDYADGASPIALKAEFVLSLFEQVMGQGKVEAMQKSIIDRCLSKVYAPYLKRSYKGKPPTLIDLCDCLREQEEPEAQELATAMELFASGSQNTFAKQTGGPVVIIIIVVICLIAAIGGTCFGIFLSNDETTGTDKTMSQAISELTSEHYANLTAMKASYSYDLFEVQGNSSINWKDVLAIYAVKTTTSTEEAMEVVTLDEKKLELLREIVNDMNTMTGIVTPKLVAETTVTTDAEGNPVKTTTYVTKKVLTVVIAQLNANQTAEIYKFDDEQKSQLAELMSEEYDPLWIELIGSNGDIVIGEGSWQGTDMFTWPLAVDGTITSRFGTRKDPISGEIKTHGGTDIAAATGTSILAAADGTVISATWHNSYGYYVKIKHNDTYSTLYAHCSALLVSEGQQVKQGQVIAQVGSTGYSTGPHLHFEVIQNGVRVDALKYYAQ